jgi:hypothetical protein
MTVRLSSGLRSAMMDYYGLQAMMRYGHIRVYTGSQPATADSAATGTLLGIVSQDGLTPIPNELAGGLQFQAGYLAGSLTKSGDWVLTGVATGTPGWWRFQWNGADDGSESTTLPRIDGAVDESLFLGTDTITIYTGVPIQSFNMVFPQE